MEQRFTCLSSLDLEVAQLNVISIYVVSVSGKWTSVTIFINKFFPSSSFIPVTNYIHLTSIEYFTFGTSQTLKLQHPILKSLQRISVALCWSGFTAVSIFPSSFVAQLNILC